jgi:RNA recognition motif-containing protein
LGYPYEICRTYSLYKLIFFLTHLEGLSLFVGDIGPDVTVDDLRNAFQDPENSVADARIVMDPTSGRTKGYGFVTFQDSEAATRALSKNGEILKGRKMRVNWASTTKDQKPGAQQQFIPPQDVYAQPMPGIVRNEYQVTLSTMAQFDGLDVGWYLRLPQDFQAGIVRVSQEAPGAKVVWVGNLDKTTNRTTSILFKLTVETDLMPLFSSYGLVEEITMVSPNGYAFVSYVPH